jgi:formate dehydrogenase major subunit
MQPGVVYTTFHFPGTAVNVITTEFADWATDCPEYKVTAVQVNRAMKTSDWQEKYHQLREATTKIGAEAKA